MDTLLGHKLGPGDIGQPKKILEVGYEHKLSRLLGSLVKPFLAALGLEHGEPKYLCTSLLVLYDR